MRSLVTGGAGFIGSHIVDAALAAGHEVAALDNLSSGKRENLPADVPLFVVDVRDRDATRKVFAEFKPDVVSHQAAQASVSVSMRDPSLDAAVNVLGGIVVADACVEYGVKRIVFASTGGAIYGEVREGPRADENHTKDPISPYAIHKLTYEQLLAVYQRTHGLETRILRDANVYGPRQDPHGEAGVVAIFFNRAQAGEGLQVNARKQAGDPGCVRDYVFLSDVARANRAALAADATDTVLNISGPAPITTLELVRLVTELAGQDLEPEHIVPDPKKVRLTSGGPWRLDHAAAERVIGWRPEVDMREGIRRLLAWREA